MTGSLPVKEEESTTCSFLKLPVDQDVVCCFLPLELAVGGKIPSKLPQLTGTGATCKYMRFDTAADLRARKAELVEVVRAWCDWKS